MICDQTEINNSTAHRFLLHLEREGCVMRTETGAFVIGPKLSQMGARRSHGATLLAISRPFLRELWKNTQESVSLGVLDKGEVVYLEVLESPHEFRLVGRVGMHRPIYSTALGKALAAFLPHQEREEVLNSINFHALTRHTITSPAQFRSDLEIVRQKGYSVDNHETILGVRCIAAPILNSNQVAVAAISVSGPSTRISQKKVSAFAKAVVEAARAISAYTGFAELPPSREGHAVMGRGAEHAMV